MIFSQIEMIILLISIVELIWYIYKATIRIIFLSFAKSVFHNIYSIYYADSWRYWEPGQKESNCEKYTASQLRRRFYIHTIGYLGGLYCRNQHFRKFIRYNNHKKTYHWYLNHIAKDSISFLHSYQITIFRWIIWYIYIAVVSIGWTTD